MPELQVYSPTEVTFGNFVKCFFVRGFTDGSTVPPARILEITSITLSFFPSGAATVGRADIAGRDQPDVGTGDAVWRLQVVYVEPKKSVHLTFPKALRLEANGHVEVGFVEDGPGAILVELNGVLVGPGE
jgi:hypothetical protein